MKFNVRIKRKMERSIDELPDDVFQKFMLLKAELEQIGPVRSNWPNYSKLGKNKYHCHLNYSWVACWYYEKGILEIEVTYVGSRERAPY